MLPLEPLPVGSQALVVSQPMFFPWVGMLEQIRLCETYVFYDDVQFVRGFFNRVQIKTGSGIRWLTVPLKGRRQTSRICDLEVDDGGAWRASALDILRQAYSDAPFRRDMLDVVDSVLSAPLSRLSDLSRASTMALARYFGLDAGWRFLDASALGVGGESSRRLLDLCERLGARRYITGHGARNYLDHGMFEARGIAVEYMDYRLSAYPQLNGPFTPYVTALDLIANCGPAGIAHICSGTRPWREVCAVVDGAGQAAPAVPAETE